MFNKRLVFVAPLFYLVLSQPAIASSKLIKQYKQAEKKQLVIKAKRDQHIHEKLKRIAAKPQQKMIKLVEARKPGLVAKLRRQAHQIQKLNIPSKLKSKKVKQLLTPYQSLFKDVAREMKGEAVYMQKSIKGLFKDLGCLFDKYLNIYCQDNSQPDVQIVEDLAFTPGFDDSEWSLSSALIGFGDATANESTGHLETISEAIDAGTHSAMAGMVQTFSVPPQMDRVKVNSTLEVDYSMISFAIFGITWGTSEGYLNVYGDNSYKCQAGHLFSSLIAPVLYFATDFGEEVKTLTCEFTPNPDGGDYVVASGVRSVTAAALPAATIAETSADVREIQVQFIYE
jgi:hypothetical protein